DLDGTNSFVELPSNLFTNEVVTVEGWIKWRNLAAYSRMFDLYGQNLQFGVQNRDTSGTLHAERMERDAAGAIKGFSHLQALNVLTSNQWYHVAVVARANATKLYVNGALVVTNESSNDWKPPREPDRANYLGRSAFASQRQLGADPDLNGQMSEVRIWAGERTAEEIQTNLVNHLTGNEPGLIALWNFDDPVNGGRDASPNGHHGELKGNARVIEERSVIAGDNLVSSSQNRVLDLA